MINQRVYNAMIQAADFIERNPEMYRFMQGIVPKNHESLQNYGGCLLATVGYFHGMEEIPYSEKFPLKNVHVCGQVAEEILGTTEYNFYRRMAGLPEGTKDYEVWTAVNQNYWGSFMRGATSNTFNHAKMAVPFLRQLAEEYNPRRLPVPLAA